MADLITKLAEAIAGPGDSPTTTLRIATVSAVESTGSHRVQTSQTGTTWLSRDAGSTLTIGDRVWVLQQKGVWFVGGRLEGGESTPIGSVSAYAGATAPVGWLMCDGSAVSRTTYSSLFAVVSTTYGTGDGSTTFNLPNLLNRVPVGSGSTYSRGATGGAASVTLSAANLPAHDHGSAGDHTHSAGVGTGAATVASGTGASVSNASSTTTSTNGAHTHATVGSGTSYSNMPPYLALPYIIRAL